MMRHVFAALTFTLFGVVANKLIKRFTGDPESRMMRRELRSFERQRRVVSASPDLTEMIMDGPIRRSGHNFIPHARYGYGD